MNERSPLIENVAARWSVVFAIAGGIALLACGSWAQSSAEALAGATSKADEALAEAAGEAVGLSAAVAVDGEIVWSRGYGWADRDAKIEATPQTPYRVYSLVKPMTAVAASALMERGLFDADAPIQRYVGSFPEKPEGPISPRQLATHSSGIRHYRDMDEARGGRACETPADALPIFADDPLVQAPGAGRSYSSWGFVLLSAAMENAAGTPFDELMAREVFEPAGMTATVLDDGRNERSAAYRGYARAEDGDLEPSPPVDNSCKWGAGGYLSSAEDLVRFLSAFADGRIASEATRAEFLRGEHEYSAVGWSEGGMGYMKVDVESGVAVAITTNTLSEPLGKTLRKQLDKIEKRVSKAVR